MNPLVMSSEVETSLDFPAAEIARDSSTTLRSARNDNRLEEVFELRVSPLIRHSTLIIRHYV
jgi:hypothetical protein